MNLLYEKSQNEKWNFEGYSHERIRRLSIDRFYEIVFGDADAFFKLCKVLPEVITDVLRDVKLGKLQINVYEELKALSPDLLKSPYLLAFKTYEGFGSWLNED